MLVSSLEDKTHRKTDRSSTKSNLSFPKKCSNRTEIPHFPDPTPPTPREKPTIRKRGRVQPLRIVNRGTASGPLIQVRNAELKGAKIREISYSPIPKEYVPTRKSMPGDLWYRSEASVKLTYRL